MRHMLKIKIKHTLVYLLSIRILTSHVNKENSQDKKPYSILLTNLILHARLHIFMYFFAQLAV